MTVASISVVLGGKKALRQTVSSDAELLSLTRQGLPVGAFQILAQRMAVERKVLAKLVGISERTLSRRVADQSRLNAEESDRTVRVARVMAQAIDTLGTGDKASRWLQQPNRALEGQVPLELLDTDAGTRTVETVLTRIEYGIYS